MGWEGRWNSVFKPYIRSGCSVTVNCVDGCPVKEFVKDFLKKKKKNLIKKNPRHLIGFNAALFSWLLHMIFCLSPLLPVCSDGTVPTRKLDSPCCRDARCRMNTWTTGKKKVAYRHFWLPARHSCIAERTLKKKSKNLHQNPKKQRWLTFQKM